MRIETILTVVTIIMSVVMPIVSFLFGIILYQSRKRIDGIEQKADQAIEKADQSKQEIQEVKDNYVQRFDEVKVQINTTEKSILAAIHKTQLYAANNYVQKNECPLLHVNKTQQLAGVGS